MTADAAPDRQELEARLLAERVARRAKLIEQAKGKIAWSSSDWVNMVTNVAIGVLLLIGGLWQLRGLSVTETRLLIGLLGYIMGASFIAQNVVLRIRYRLNALAELVESSTSNVT